MTTYLQQLAKWVLQAQSNGLSKVRFAKTLYFAHKYLIAEGLSRPLDIQFIRMPLGPVPVGFDGLSALAAFVIEHRSTGLSYDQQVYKLAAAQHSDSSDNQSRDVARVAAQHLKKLSTSQLVEYSHAEPSWIGHRNGEEYFINNDDLRRGLPSIQDKQYVSVALDNQHLQARLIAGMLDEIVDESTALEYPGDGQSGESR